MAGALASGIASYNAGRFDEAARTFEACGPSRGRSPELRCLLANALYSAGKIKPAMREFSVALRNDPRHLPAYRGLAEIILRERLQEEAGPLLARLARLRARSEQERGVLANIRSALEKARCLARSSAERPPPWQNKFRAHMAAGRFVEAFFLGEMILDRKPELSDLRTFWNPWTGRNTAKHAAQLAEMDRRARLSLRLQPWLAYYRYSYGFNNDSSLAWLWRLNQRRYGWMHLLIGRSALSAGCWKESEEHLLAALRFRPADWWAHGFLAELEILRGRPGRVELHLRQARRLAGSSEQGGVLAWKGELDLWRGRYQQALDGLEQACRFKSHNAYCWRGGALLKLGRRQEALVALNEALRILPNDGEAAVWRGETLRELGRPREALKDLSGETAGIWTSVNRALCHLELGAVASARADFLALPKFLVTGVRRRLRMGDPQALGPDQMRPVLLGALRLAKGFRREDYSQMTWLGQEATSAR